MKEIEAHPKAIMFIDEIHTLIGAGATSGGAMDASNLLKHALAQTLATLQGIPLDALLVQRRKRLAGYGVFKEG
jgi:acetyl-CoA carboxylase alpha subunit